MKKLFLVFFTLVICFMKSQDIISIIKNNPSKRTDLKIPFNEENPHHYIPISVISGKEKEPVFTILAGVHGYEYPPIMAVQELMKEIDPAKLKGTLIILPITNIGAFYERVPYLNPTDKKNLNTVFPGKENGTITEKIANYITKNIIPISDVFLDIHGGDANEDLVPFVCYYDNKDSVEKTKTALKLSEVSVLPYIVSYPYNISKTEPALYAFKQAVQNDIVALSLEAGKLGVNGADEVKMLKESIYNMIGIMKMYSSSPYKKPASRKTFTKQTYIKVPISGIFYSKHKAGEYVKKGEDLGYITDEFGNLLQKISAPESGMILYKIGTPPVNKGETMFCITS